MLAVAVLGISSSAVLVRAMEAGPVAITFWRCVFASVLLSPALPAARALGLRDLLAILVAGALLGLHFATWFASLAHTTVLRSTVLVALVPLWTAGLEWLWHGRRPSARFVTGILVAVAGVGLLATGDGAGGLRGDALAALAGAIWAFYLLVGSDVRPRVPVATFMGLVSVAAALVMLPASWLTAEPLTGFPGSTWLLIGLATLGPQLLGHQGFSYAVRYVPASTIAAIMLLEPVGASSLAALVYAEVPGPAAGMGGLVVLGGLLLALGRTRSAAD